jgi:hypothetical protein
VWDDALEDALLEMLRSCTYLANLHCTRSDFDSAADVNHPSSHYGPRAIAALVCTALRMAVQELTVHSLHVAALQYLCSHSPAPCAYEQSSRHA